MEISVTRFLFVSFKLKVHYSGQRISAAGGADALQHQGPRINPDIGYCLFGVCMFSTWVYSWCSGSLPHVRVCSVS